MARAYRLASRARGGRARAGPRLRSRAGGRWAPRAALCAGPGLGVVCASAS